MDFWFSTFHFPSQPYADPTDDPDSKVCVDIRYSLAQLYLYSGDHDTANEEVDIGLVENPHHPGLQSTRALLKVLRCCDEADVVDNCSTSAQELWKLAQDYPRSRHWQVLIQVRLGYLYLRAGNFSQALKVGLRIMRALRATCAEAVFMQCEGRTRS